MKIPQYVTKQLKECDESPFSAGQLERLRLIINAPTFDFACELPTTPERGIFTFLFYTTDGSLNYIRVGKNGALLKSIIT